MESPLLEFDRNHLWHPYTSMTDPLPVYEVESASGVRLKLKGGKELIDGMASWWCAIHGYNHPVLNGAIHEQTSRMAHVMFGGITHKPAVGLATRLLDMTAPSLDKIFFCDSGSISVEVAIKMAIQYWKARGEEKKNRLLTVRGGYHGDTFGAMAVCDPVNGMHGLFKGLLPLHLFTDAPRVPFDGEWDDSDMTGIEDILKEKGREVAAVILEPIVQGVGGMRFYSPRYLEELRRLCDQYGVLLIFDEIATGFGRTGKLFAYEHTAITPDILCLGKALTGGYMTLAATLTTEDVSHTISSGNPGLFMHGPTFMANPLACAVATASLDLLLSSPWQERISALEAALKEGLSPCVTMAQVEEVRVLGAIGVVEMKHPVDVAAYQKRLVEKGVWVRPFGKLVYVMPPYIMTGEEAGILCSAIVDVVGENPPEP